MTDDEIQEMRRLADPDGVSFDRTLFAFTRLRDLAQKAADELARARDLDSAPHPRFAPGDVVRLKSGGPAMTVIREHEYQLDPGKKTASVEVSWVSEHGGHARIYPEIALEPAVIIERIMDRIDECAAEQAR